MKRFFLIIVLMIIVLYGFNLTSKADCITGFACSLNELQQKEDALEFVTAINNYFSKQVKTPDFVKHKTEITDYNDIFIFNTIV